MGRINKLKQVLDRGDIAKGTAVFSSSPAIIEIAGYSGLDFVRVDNEHSWRRDEAMEHMMRAAMIANITPMVRVDKDDPYVIRKAMEIGAGAILVPDVSTKEEAQKVVSAAKFPPTGIRGYNSFCFSGCWGSTPGADWVEWSEREILIGIMIENVEVISQLDAVLSVERLDYVLFGPGDYSMSLGLRSPQKNHPKVQDALKRTIEVSNKYNKPVAIGIGPPLKEEAEKYIDLGCRIIEVSNDVLLLRNAWAPLATAI